MVAKKSTMVCGIGVNDVKTPTETIINGKRVPDQFYQIWSGMIRRCYDKKLHRRQPSYIGCTVCEEWIYFSKFKKWMENQDWKGKHLDKDLLVGGNKIYSPNTCLFISGKLNSSLVLSNSSRGKYPVGCNYKKSGDCYVAQCTDSKGGRVHLGCFETPHEAHRAWQLSKIDILERLKINEKEVIVQNCLQKIIDKIQSEYDSNLETINFN